MIFYDKKRNFKNKVSYFRTLLEGYSILSHGFEKLKLSVRLYQYPSDYTDKYVSIDTMLEPSITGLSPCSDIILKARF